MSLEHPPPPPTIINRKYSIREITYCKFYIAEVDFGTLVYSIVSMYSALQWCHIRCIYRLKLCRQDMLELLRGTVSSRRSFIQQRHSFISTVGRSITFAYRIVASHLMVSARRRQQKAYAVVKLTELYKLAQWLKCTYMYC